MPLKFRVNFYEAVNKIQDNYANRNTIEFNRLKFDAIRESVVEPPQLSKDAKEIDFWEYFHEWEKGGADKMNQLTGEIEISEDEGINALHAFEQLFIAVNNYNIEGRIAELEKKSQTSEADTSDSTK